MSANLYDIHHFCVYNKLQLLSPSFLRSANCSPSLWSVVVWVQSESVLWYSLQVWKPVPSVFIHLVQYTCNPQFAAYVVICFVVIKGVAWRGLSNFISAASILRLCKAVRFQFSDPYTNVGKTSLLYIFKIVSALTFLKIFLLIVPINCKIFANLNFWTKHFVKFFREKVFIMHLHLSSRPQNKF